MTTKEKKGVFFSTDALIALIIIMLSILVIYPITQHRQHESEVPKDVLKVLSTLKIGEINNPYVEQLRIQGKIHDAGKSVLEQIGEFYVTNITIAKKLTESVLSTIETNENIGLWFGTTFIASRNNTPIETSSDISVERQLVSGISGEHEGESSTGFSARAYLTSATHKKYFYFGGYIGDGNISMNLDYTGLLTNVDIEIVPSRQFQIYINGIFSGVYSNSSSPFTPAKYNLSDYKNNFNSGSNNVKFVGVGGNLYIAGGFIKITYADSVQYEQAAKHNFPGIKGLINIYDGFYVPNNLDSMEIFLHYNSSYKMFLNIGNITVFNGSSASETTETISDAKLRTLLDYSDIVKKTVPLKLGLENISLKESSPADIVFIIDSTGSMQNEIGQVASIIRQFAELLEKSSIDYRLGLIDFRDCPNSSIGECGATNDFPHRKHIFYDTMIINRNADWKKGILTGVTTLGNYLVLIHDPDIKVVVADQSQPNAPNKTNIHGNKIVAQTFRPSITGNLTNVTVRVGKVGNPGPLVMEVKDTIGGMPGPTILATSERSDIGLFNDYRFNFNNPAFLTAETSYSIVLKVKNNAGDLTNNYNVSYYAQYWDPRSGNMQDPSRWSSDAYSRGQYCNSTNNGAIWACLDSCTNYSRIESKCNKTDLYFRIYMINEGYLRTGEAINTYAPGRIFDWYNFSVGRAGLPAGTSMSISFRSSEDSVIWSEWYDYGGKTTGSLENVPDGRYLQQKIVLNSDGNYTPTIYSTTIYSNREEFTTNVTKYRNEVNTIIASGGKDDPESHLAALNLSMFLEWRSDAKKFDILLSDAPPHAADCIWNGATTDKLCYKGPKYAEEIMNEFLAKGMIFFYINQEEGLCENDILANNMTNLTGGKFYNYNKARGVEEILQEIANKILSLTYSEQTMESTSNISTFLYPDSYIKFDYAKESLPYGLITTSEKLFDTEYIGRFYIPSDAKLIEAKVVSYSGPRWTNDVKINNNLIYQLSKYGEDYTKLGDPYAISIPISSIPLIANTINITTGVSPTNTSSGSHNNKIIYTLVKNLSSYSPISGFDRGCSWELEFEDNTTTSVNIPADYSGTDTCYYEKEKRYCIVEGSQKLCEETNDAIIVAAYRLFEQLDLDSNSKLEVKFTEQDLQIDFTEVTGIPYAWSSEAQVRRWD